MKAGTMPTPRSSDVVCPACVSGGRGRWQRSGRGGSLIEAVMVLSILVMLSLGAAEYGYAFYVKHSLEAAATVGVRTAILSLSTDTAVDAAITSQMTLAGLQNSGYTVVTNPTSVNGAGAGTFVTVTVSCTWGNCGITPLPTALGGIASTKTYSAAAMMVHE